MAKRIPNPTYETFKNTILKASLSGRITPADIREFDIPIDIAKAWLSRYNNELHEYNAATKMMIWKEKAEGTLDDIDCLQKKRGYKFRDLLPTLWAIGAALMSLSYKE